VLGGVCFSGSFCDFEIFLALLCLFSWFAAFHANCWLYGFSFFYITFMSFSLDFGHLAVLHVSWIQNSNFVLFVINVLIKGEIEKPSGQYLGLIVMSNRLALI
jgi:hypothetical protein